MTLQERFAPENLIAAACDQAGSDDFGEDGWQPGLERVADGLINEARLSAIGVEVAYLDMIRALTSRLGVTAWRKEHPEIGDKPITSPIFIVGQPRTGTTIIFDLLAQDPGLRAPLTWEVDAPCPVPQPETYQTDPRIAQTQATIEMSEQIIPGFLKFHPMGALVGQECVRITASEFTSMIFSVQYRLPSYSRWLMYDADHTGAYRFHRIFLQHLQSGVKGQWLLKSPAHLWQLDKLLAEYPDALVVQTHRDPLNVISSIAALTNHLRRMGSDETNIAECAAQSYEEIVVGLDRGIALRDKGVVPDGRIIDVQFTDFMKDPLHTIADIYQKLGRELRPEAEQKMRDFLAAHPGAAATAATPGRTPA
ncbi:sulfotransferase family protein [Mycobacterium montefiorense]|nr:sulfotransferase family protein [Mycobacterium montefiorense]